MAVHLLHIGKTGGTALKTALRDADVTTTAFGELLLHGHDTTLEHLPATDVAVCVLREPVSRFVSAFYSRRRMGRPRYLSRWSAAEALAFARFPSAASLAEALADGRAAARFAMRSIAHLNRHYTYWLGPVDDDRRRDRLVFVGRQETLERDLERLRTLLQIDRPVALPADPVAAHRSPTRQHPPISTRALDALTRWYADDYALLRRLDEHPSRRDD